MGLKRGRRESCESGRELGQQMDGREGTEHGEMGECSRRAGLREALVQEETGTVLGMEGRSSGQQPSLRLCALHSKPQPCPQHEGSRRTPRSPQCRKETPSTAPGLRPASCRALWLGAEGPACNLCFPAAITKPRAPQHRGDGRWPTP